MMQILYNKILLKLGTTLSKYRNDIGGKNNVYDEIPSN
jgi:hypothetical protein